MIFKLIATVILLRTYHSQHLSLREHYKAYTIFMSTDLELPLSELLNRLKRCLR